jgi:hypothetical protein
MSSRSFAALLPAFSSPEPAFDQKPGADVLEPN